MQIFNLEYLGTYAIGIRGKGFAILVNCNGKKQLLHIDTYTPSYFKTDGYFIKLTKAVEKTKGNTSILIGEKPNDKYHYARHNPLDLISILQRWETSSNKSKNQIYNVDKQSFKRI